MRRTRALIVGGGPAGSAAAITLACQGLAPALVERSSAPSDVVCGGFLSWDALAALEGLGVDPWAIGARPIERLRLVSGRRIVETTLPQRAAGLSRRRLDEALIAAAAGAGAAVRRGCGVRAAQGRKARLDSGEEVEAEALFLATGKHALRGLSPKRSGGGLAVGCRKALGGEAATADLAGVVELHLFDGGYAGLLLQEDGRANLCLSLGPDRLRAAGGIAPAIASLEAQLPILRQRLSGAQAGGWQAIAGIAYGWRASGTQTGLFRIGDQAAVIASLAGDGIAIALASGAAAANALLANGPEGAGAFQEHFSKRSRRPLAIASALRAAAESPLARPLMLGLAPFAAPLAARLTRIG